MPESTQPKREDFEKLLSAAYLLQGRPDSGRRENHQEKQREEQAHQHAEVLSKVLALQTLFELEQLNFEGAARATVKFAMETLQCYGAAIGLVEGKHICYCASSGMSLIPAKHMPLTTSPSALCIQSKAAFASADVPSDERLPAIIRNVEWLGSLVVIPIFQRQDVAATLEMYFRSSRGFEVTDINTYEVLGIVIGKALLTDANTKIRDKLESERADTNARLQQLRPQLELLSGEPKIPGCEELDCEVPSPQDRMPIPKATDLALSCAMQVPKDRFHKGPRLDQVFDPAANSEFDPISALLITESQISTGEVSTLGTSGEMPCARTGPISLPISPIKTKQETLSKTSKNRGVGSRKDSIRWRANFYLVFAGVVVVWSLFFHEAGVLPIVSEGEQTAEKSVADKRAQPAFKNGNPGATVWVDLKHFEYYCSDSQRYGRTQHGEFMTQSEAQLSQYQSAQHRTCK